MQQTAIQKAADSINEYATAGFSIAQRSRQLLARAEAALESAKAHQAHESTEMRPTQWEFSVTRDSRGLMDQIVATPVFD